MGWTGIQKLYKSNLDNIKHGYLYGKTEDEHYWYRDITQRGSSVYVLYQSKKTLEYCVICYLCQSVRRKGYSEFMYKDIDAVYNNCFDFPKKWVSLLNHNDNEVQRYIKARSAYELKVKSEHKTKIGDIFKCTAPYKLSWSSVSIEKDENFHVQYTDKYGGRMYILCDAFGNLSNLKISRNHFKKLQKEFVRNARA